MRPSGGSLPYDIVAILFLCGIAVAATGAGAAFWQAIPSIVEGNDEAQSSTCGPAPALLAAV